ncbi:MAG: transglycosylase domain-containing protein [Bdellovibrionales bacterium]
MSVWHTLSRVVLTTIWVVIIAAVIYAIHYELTTSRLQAELFSRYAKNMTYELQDGPNPNLPYPEGGPYDVRLGYTRLPKMLDTLTVQGFKIIRQPRLSQPLQEFMAMGGYAIYPEKTSAGITILGAQGNELHSRRFPTRTFADYDEIPPLVAQTLLFIENRELLDPATPYRNPAVEWDRFLFAALGQLVKVLNPGMNIGGGSTLATQIEKFRHSDEGRTGGIHDKLIQMLSASVRAYRQGPLTMEERKRVVLDYMNSTPLTARAGLGEVNGLGDGLWAWFGTELNDVIDMLSRQANDVETFTRQAELYKQVLALLLAQRRPSYYLITDREALNELANTYLQLLSTAGIITPALQKVATSSPLRFSSEVHIPGGEDFVALKAANAVRLALLRTLNLNSLYELDRIDATVHSTLDSEKQDKVISLLQDLMDKSKLEEHGLIGENLLRTDNDVSKVIYSFVLYERTPFGNVVRVQADNLDKPLDLNEGAKLDLGSTAKLRTLETYLSALADLYDRYKQLQKADLQIAQDDAADNLTRWVVDMLRAYPDITLQQLLASAMTRRYSASTNETFFTGGGAHTFVNFQSTDNGKVVSVQEALRMSINLPFVRLMRDVVGYYIAQGPIARRDILGNPDNPARQAYLARYADREGRTFLNRFYNAYRNLTPEAALDRLAGRGRKTWEAQATIFRSIKPKAGQTAFRNFMTARMTTLGLATPTFEEASALYENYGMDKYNLADRGYIAGVNPLELWLAAYMQSNPKASRDQILQASVEERQAAYEWLFRTGYKGAQDTRIRILLEQDAFNRIHQHWEKLGYPFDHLVPSLATSIGSSADRPGALAELMGIILNDGIRMPTIRVSEIEFAKGTPYETLLRRDGAQQVQGERVIRSEVAQTLKAALADVVENGTAKRMKGVVVDGAGQPVPIGGKTGTGDHRFELFGPGGRLISSRAVARTATFVFYLGDKYFGTITAHVEGEEADKYEFTSGMVSQVLKTIIGKIGPLY